MRACGCQAGARPAAGGCDSGKLVAGLEVAETVWAPRGGTGVGREGHLEQTGRAGVASRAAAQAGHGPAPAAPTRLRFSL